MGLETNIEWGSLDSDRHILQVLSYLWILSLNFYMQVYNLEQLQKSS